MYLIKFCYDGADEFGVSGAYICKEEEKENLMFPLEQMTKFYRQLAESAFDEPKVNVWVGGDVSIELVGADLMDYFTCEMISVTEAETLLRLMGNDGLHGAPCIGFFPDVETMYDEFLETFDTEEDE